MRIRAGIVLIEDNKVALMERDRAGLHYFVFPGGGVDEGETPEQAAIRERLEELGIEVAIKQKVAEVQIGEKGRQIHFIVEYLKGKFGTGTGEEFTDSDPNNAEEGTYIPMWMPIEDLPGHTNVFPADLAKIVLDSLKTGWAREPTLLFEDLK